jgi:hypothetical protein
VGEETGQLAPGEGWLVHVGDGSRRGGKGGAGRGIDIDHEAEQSLPPHKQYTCSCGGQKEQENDSFVHVHDVQSRAGKMKTLLLTRPLRMDGNLVERHVKQGWELVGDEEPSGG